MDSELVPSFLSREDQDTSTQLVERSRATEEEAFHKGYQLTMFEVQRQMNLRNREVPIVESRRTVPDTSTSKQRNVVPPKVLSKSIPEPKAKEKKVEDPKHVELALTYFSLENEIAKIKIAIPLTELLKNADYQSQISKVLNPPCKNPTVVDALNL